MRKWIIVLMVLVSFGVKATPDIEYLNPMEYDEEMPYRWCVKNEKSDKSREIFKTFFEVKEYMRSRNLTYVYIQDCFVDEKIIPVKYRRLNRIYRKDNIYGDVYANDSNTKTSVK